MTASSLRACCTVDQSPFVMPDSSYGSGDSSDEEDSRDEEMGYSSSDGEEEPLMYGIRGPRRSTMPDCLSGVLTF